jgi:uncharacterized membrane protein
MFDRKEIKARGKLAFQANYWRCVLVALILFAIAGGGAASGRSSSHHSANDGQDVKIESVDDLKQYIQKEMGMSNALTDGMLAMVGAVAGTVILIGSVLKLLVVNPLEVGCCQFFLRNSDSPAEVGEISRAFKPEWLHNVISMLLRDLFIVLWSLLLIVPGIIKAYAFRLTPYIQAEHPELGGTEALRASEQMMKGHKWEAFVYDLSFFGWYLAAAFTLGILGIFYVNPYKAASDAELYRAISADYRVDSEPFDAPGY